MKKLNIAILGAGALGCFLGGYLAQDHSVVLYGRKERMDKIKKEHLRFSSGLTGNKEIDINTTTDLSNKKFDLGIIGVKSYNTYDILSELKKQRVSLDMIASVQNGLKDDLLKKIFGTDKVLGCVVNEAVRTVDLNTISYFNSGHSYFGNFNHEKNPDKSRIAEYLSRTLSDQGVKSAHSNIMDLITWYKNLSFASANAVDGAFKLDVSQKYLNPKIRSLYINIADENKKIALAEKIALKPHPALKDLFLADNKEEMNNIMISNKDKFSENYKPRFSSLVRDIKDSKNQTESDFIVGTMLLKANKNHISIPVMQRMYGLIKSNEYENKISNATYSFFHNI